MKPFRYKLESEKYDNRSPKYFLVRYISFKGKHSRVRQYLGTTKPTPEVLAKAIRDFAYDLELKAAEKIADMACSYYTTDYLSVHVHRPPAVTLNETPKEFHISTGLCQKI